MAARPTRRPRVIALLAAVALPFAFAVTDGNSAPAAAVEDACPPPDLPPTDFADIGGTHEDAIRCLSWYGLVTGRTSTTFDAQGHNTRGQFASLLVRTLEAADVALPAPSSPGSFDDVDDSTHGESLERLHAAGLMDGTAPRTASPGRVLTRGQLAALVVAAVEYAEDTTLTERSQPFTDTDGAYHADAIHRAAAAGLVSGRADGSYGPGEGLRRGQTATVLTRTLERFVADGRLAKPPVPDMRWESSVVPSAVREQMAGVSMHAGCPVGYDDLRLVVLTHRGFDGRMHRGELVAHRSAVGTLRDAFRAAYDADFPLGRVVRVEHYGGDDDRSMAANNTHAFNCRRITGGSSWSRHAYGTAIDFNPVQNPYVRGDTVLPPAGRDYLDRSDVRPGMLVEGDPIVSAFDDAGWRWGGRWQSLKDYQHVEAP